MTRVAFIGLGNMGLPMARNLAKAGFDVLGHDVVDAARAAATDAGIALAPDVAAASLDRDIVITMLPNGEIAKQVTDQALAVMSVGALLIDCSTIDVKRAIEIHTSAATSGVLSLDAPVSGGVSGADAGTLTFMVGGSGDAFERAQAVLDVMGQKAVLCGDGGAGQAAKICNNMLLAVSMIGACEAFSLGEKLGLDPARLFDVMSTSSGSCWSVNTYCPVTGVGPQSPSDRQYQPGFAVALMNKDLGLAMQAAESVDADTPMGQHANQIYQTMMELGHGGQDFSAVIQHLAAIGTELKA